jgi:O-antigen/teichoic acid export membrane protein
LLLLDIVNLLPIQDVKIESLRQRALHGGAVTLSNQVLKFLLQTGSTIVMARLLTPSDFGVVAMVSSLLGFVNMLSFGLSTATVQKQSISHEELSSLFWINLLAGLFFAVILFICAPLIATFYHQPEAKYIAIAFGAMSLLSSLGSQHAALLQRQMRFGAIAARDLSAMLVGIAAGVIAALYGCHFWALIIMQAAENLSGTIFLWWKSGWCPGPPSRTVGLGKILKFGGTLTIANFLSYANNHLDNILLGKFFGVAAVGFYSKAQGLLNKPLEQVLPPIMRVATPMFSRLVEDPLRFRKAAIELTEIVCFGGCLIMMVAISTADWIVFLLLGSQWSETAPVFQLLAIFGLLEPIAWLLGTILVAFGKPEAMVKWRAITIIVVLFSFIVGLPWGIIGIAMGYTLSGIATRTWLIFFVGSRIGISGWKFLYTCAPFVLSAGSAALFLLGLRSLWEPAQALHSLIIYTFLGILTYLTCLFAIPNGRKVLKKFIDTGKDILKGMVA